jgi:hypothetical protein
MNWQQRHRFRAFVKNTLWFGPVLAILEQLIRRLPEERRQSLRNELHTVQSDANRTFVGEHDKALAKTSDSQGLGGVPEAGGLVEPAPNATLTPS